MKIKSLVEPNMLNRVVFFSFSACKHYFEKYPGDNDLLFEVEGAGFWFQRKSIASVLQREELISMDLLLFPYGL